MSNLMDELEDGEIRDDLENISDSSLTEILDIQKELSDDDAELDKLRQEALQSLPNVDEVTEEELYRLEALKSLLYHVNSASKNEESKINHSRKHKKKKKHKEDLRNHKRSKRKKNSDFISCHQSSQQYLAETTSLLSELSKDVCNISNSLLNTKNMCPSVIDKENEIQNIKITIDCKTDTSRSWYPKGELALINVPSNENDDLIIKDINYDAKTTNFTTEILPCDADSGISDCKTEISLPLFNEMYARYSNIIPKSKVFCQNNSSNQISNIKTFQQNNRFKVNHSSPLITEVFSCPDPVKISKHKIIRNGTTLPAKCQIKNSKKFNNSKYVLRKTSKPKINYSNASYNKKILKSAYSINRSAEYKCQKVNDLIIKLDDDDDDDDDDSSKGDDSKENLDIFFDTSSVVEISSVNSLRAQNDFIKDKFVPFKTCNNILCSNVIETDDTNSNDISCSLSVMKDIDESVGQNQDTNKKNVIFLPSNPDSETEYCPCTKIMNSNSKIKFSSNMNNMVAERKAKNKVSIDHLQTERKFNNIHCECVNNDEIAERKDKNDQSLLLNEAESNLIEIRKKLVQNLNELSDSIKQNTLENEKLISLTGKLAILKTTLAKFELKVKQQELKLSMSNSFMQSLFDGIALRSKNCDQLKDLCVFTGEKLLGSQYKPPCEFEDLITEKRKTIDFSKYLKQS